MDFGALPPEINSGRMYTGAGSGSMLAAATAWDGLAEELSSAAISYRSVISGLTSGPWLGPTAMAMAAAAAPYVAWMNTTAEQANQAAKQARSAAAAYEAAFAATVSPPLIMENRTFLTSLVTTNILGQNTPAIAATEAQYAQMWAQDATAMYGYAGTSATASALTPFTPPHHNTNPAVVGDQATAVGQAAATSAPTHTQTALSQLISTVPNVLQGLASGTSSAPMDNLASLFNTLGPDIGTSLSVLSGGLFDASGLLYIVSPFAATLAAAPAPVAAAQGSTLMGWSGSGLSPTGPAGLGGATAPASLGRTGVLASIGRTASINALSVPQTWAHAVAEISPAATALPETVLVGSPDAGVGPGPWYGGMPLMGGSAGEQGGGGAVRPGGGAGSRYRPRLIVMPPVSHEPDEHASTRGRWASLDQGARGGENPLSEGVRHELSDLRKQVAELAMERDVLMRAAALWAKEAMGT